MLILSNADSKLDDDDNNNDDVGVERQEEN